MQNYKAPASSATSTFASHLPSNKCHLIFFFFSTTTKQKIISSEASFLGEEHTTTFQNVYSCLDFSLQASSCPYSKAIFSFPCQRLLWPELALWACFINVTLTFTAQPHWHPDFALPIPSDARKPSGYAQTIYFGDMHWLWHSDRNEPQGREMTTSDPEKDEQSLLQHRNQGWNSISMPPSTLVGISTFVFSIFGCFGHFLELAIWI